MHSICVVKDEQMDTGSRVLLATNFCDTEQQTSTSFEGVLEKILVPDSTEESS